jgi:two-component system, NarL family, nitrate/nitrite response regulator NarL
MDAILLISSQRALIDKWHPVLALNYQVSLATNVKELPLERYAVVIIDSEIIDTQQFDVVVIKQTPAKFLIVGEEWPEDKQVKLLAAGAAGYCDNTVAASIILKAVESVLQNDIWIKRHLIHRVIEALVASTPEQKIARSDNTIPTKLSCLSKRELDVARLIIKGVSNKRIAATLFISERTVKAHLTSIFSKLQVSSRLHLGLLLKEVGQ